MISTRSRALAALGFTAGWLYSRSTTRSMAPSGVLTFLRRHSWRKISANSRGPGPAAPRRYEPAGHQLFGLNLLAAQVINHQDASLGLDMRGRLVEAGLRIVGQIQRLGPDLRSQHAGRTPAPPPASGPPFH